MDKLKLMLLLSIFSLGPSLINSQGLIINHNCTQIRAIPDEAIQEAKNILHIAYGHTSHGSQIITGMNGLDNFMGNTGLFLWGEGPSENKLDIDDYFVSGDLGNPDRTTWAARTRDYLNRSENSDVNAVMWSWCGQVSSASEEDINTYLRLMSQLETDYPNISFIYMTGHLDGSGLSGNLHLRNEQIRNYCTSNNKILFDFADIECYDPDGNYFGDKIPNDNCDYDSDGNGSRDANWALEWQDSHIQNEDWYECSSAHSQSLNANLKAYAAWWLWSKLAGWNGTTHTLNAGDPTLRFELINNYPNPFNPSTNISFSIPEDSFINLSIFDLLGNMIKNLESNYLSAGSYSTFWDGKDKHGRNVCSGIYLCVLKSGMNTDTKKLMLIR